MYVNPKTNCQHLCDSLKENTFLPYEEFQTINFPENKCYDCEENFEIWICLHCGHFFCGRYINAHMLAHYENTEHKHCICLSMMDLSFWCYGCDSYIIDANLNKYEKVVSDFKFGKNFIPTIDNVQMKMPSVMNFDSDKVANIKYYNFIELFKGGKFNKITFLIGDSCSKGLISLKNTVKELLSDKYKFEKDKDTLINLKEFEKTPQIMYDIAKVYYTNQIKADDLFYLMSLVQCKGLLHKVITQNVNCIEHSVEIKDENIKFLNGRLDKAYCSKCTTEYPVDVVKDFINKEELYYCEKCKSVVKPNILMKEEMKVNDLISAIAEINKSDLCFIIGLSLANLDLSDLYDNLNRDVYKFVINEERLGDDVFDYDNLSNNELFIKGDTETVIDKLIKDLSILDEFNAFKYKISK